MKYELEELEQRIHTPQLEGIGERLEDDVCEMLQRAGIYFRIFHRVKTPESIVDKINKDGSERFDETFDLAVAYLEGASTYYVADHVKARQKAAFVHIDYESSGYTPFMDKDCYKHMDRIFVVSDEVKKHFIKSYPQYQSKVYVFHNRIDLKKIRKRAAEPGGFTDSYEGIAPF